MAAHLFESCMVPVKSALKEADLPLDEINDIVMVGGSSRMPKLKVILIEYLWMKSDQKLENGSI